MRFPSSSSSIKRNSTILRASWPGSSPVLLHLLLLRHDPLLRRTIAIRFPTARQAQPLPSRRRPYGTHHREQLDGLPFKAIILTLIVFLKLPRFGAKRTFSDVVRLENTESVSEGVVGVGAGVIVGDDIGGVEASGAFHLGIWKVKKLFRDGIGGSRGEVEIQHCWVIRMMLLDKNGWVRIGNQNCSGWRKWDPESVMELVQL